MKRLSGLSLLLAFSLSACQMQPIVAPPPPAPSPAAAATESPSPQPLAPEIGQALQAALDAAVADPATPWPGAILHVQGPELGTWSGAAGLGDVATNTPMRAQDRFRAGSLTKPFVAAVILQLVEEGRFALDDLIAALLPADVVARFPASNRITVRMLLNHTSGLADFMAAAGPEIVADPGKVWDVGEFLDFAAAQEPMFAPGEAQYYSNTNYALLGLIIEEASGQPWRDEVRRRIFEPLGLANTFLPAPEDKTMPGDHAHGYADFGQGPFDATELVTASIVGAAGGQSMVTNAEDLATFLDALLDGRLFQTSESLTEMLSMAPFGPDQDLAVVVKEYGLGLNRASFGDGITAIGHSGDTEGGYSSFVYHFPSLGVTMAGAVNTMDPAAGYRELMGRALEVLFPGYSRSALGAAPAPEAGDEAGAALQGLVDDEVKKQGILGMFMAARLADGTVISRSAGSLDPAGEERWTMQTQSALGSVTKTFTGVVIMQLIEEGSLSLDDTIDQWFPDQPNGERITVRMLLSHTSGLSNFIQPENERDPMWSQEWTPEALIAEANRIGPVAEPGGSDAHYSNTNYFVLGLIVEAITGNRWEEEVRSRIIEPLGLQDTAFVSEEGVWGGTLVPGYGKTPDGFISTLEIPNLPHATTAWAAGGVVSTLADLMTFAGALFDGKIVSKESLAQMATGIGADPDGMRVWGLGGATLKGVPGSYGMGGDAPGYHAIFVGLAESNLIVAGLINTEEGDVVMPALTAFDYLYAQLPSSSQVAQEAATVAPAPPQSGAAAALQALVDDQVREQDILGMTMAVRMPDGSTLASSSGYTDDEKQTPWSVDTLSALGSVTKTFVAVVLMQLVEEGRIALDDTIDRWFPDQPNRDRITVRMLLSHTSGLANYISAANVMEPKWAVEWTPLELVAEANRLGPVGEPGGDAAHYANTNYILLAQIIEQITGSDWAQEVRSRIIEPLGLKQTTFLDEEGVWGGAMVEGYTRTPAGYVGTLELPSYPHPSTSAAAGAIVSSAADLLTFATALFDGALVSQESLAEMATPLAQDADGMLWGLGGGTIEGLPAGAYGMGGDIPGYHAFFMGVQGTPFAVAALTNTEEGDVITPSLMVLEFVRSMLPAAE